MDLYTLNRHCDLVQQFKNAKELYATTEAKGLGAQRLTGMPHGTGVSDNTGALAAALADISGQVSYLEKRIMESSPEIEEFIAGIPVLKTRLIFRYRFLCGMSWGEVAGMFDIGTTETSVKNTVYDYLEKQNQQSVTDED